MSWQMEHRFLYERLKKPRSERDRFMRGLIETAEMARKSGEFSFGDVVEGGRMTLIRRNQGSCLPQYRRSRSSGIPKSHQVSGSR